MRRLLAPLSLSLSAALFSIGCTQPVIAPPLYPDIARNKTPSATLQRATSWPFSKTAKVRWSGQDTIEVGSYTGWRTDGVGHFRAHVAFTLALPDMSVACQTEPKNDRVGVARFGCWSTSAPMGDPAAFTFEIAPGRDCPTRDAAYARTFFTPACWEGVLRADGFEARLLHGRFPNGAPLGLVSWIGPDQRLLLAADFIDDVLGYDGPSTYRTSLFDGPGEVPATTKRKLVLATLALAYWEDALEVE